jgi:histidinol-phosphate aminotransferase
MIMRDSSQLSERAIHGALDYDELRRLDIHPDDILDFSVNSNPYGPSPHVRDAISKVSIERYPDRECWQLRQTILDYELIGSQLPLSSLICGNGTSELIWTIARVCLKLGDTTLIIGPTFGEYEVAVQAAGATVLEIQSQAEQNFQFDIAALCSTLRQERPRLVWLCNPNNPTGGWLGRQALVELVDECSRVGALLVVDESYRHFVWPAETFSAVDFVTSSKSSPVLVLRSLTKDFALAGVRLGYAVGSADLIRQLQVQLPAWNVSGIAQAAGEAALSDRAHFEQSMAQLRHEREAFFAALQQAGLHVVPSRTHFCLIEVDDAQRVRQQLLQRRLLVRDCTSFGLPQYIRVSTHPESAWRQLVSALQEVINIL